MKVLWCLKGYLGQATLQMRKLKSKEEEGLINILEHILLRSKLEPRSSAPEYILSSIVPQLYKAEQFYQEEV